MQLRFVLHHHHDSHAQRLSAASISRTDALFRSRNMSNFARVLSDDNNPFYCPDQSSTAFIQTLRHKLSSDNFQEHELRASFNRSLLHKSADDENLFPQYTRGYSVIEDAYMHSWDQSDEYRSSPGVFTSVIADNLVRLCSSNKRKRCVETFSDFEGPIKRGRSHDYVNYDSFELSGKADKICYSYPEIPYPFSPPHLALASMSLARNNADSLVERITDLEGTSVLRPKRWDFDVP